MSDHYGLHKKERLTCVDRHVPAVTMKITLRQSHRRIISSGGDGDWQPQVKSEFLDSLCDYAAGLDPTDAGVIICDIYDSRVVHSTLRRHESHDSAR